MEITFKGRHTSVPERFRRHASAKLAKLEKLDHNAIRIDVEVSTERNPRQADRSERVELTIRSRGPAIRAEAAADDRYAALDLAFIKLEGRLRKAAERRKTRRSDLTVRSTDALTAVAAAPAEASVIAAEAAALADVDIPAIPRPDDAAVLDGTPVGRRANSRTAGKPSARVTAKVGLGKTESGGFGLTVALDVSIPNLERDAAAALVEQAHDVCPYSNATRGNVEVTLSVV